MERCEERRGAVWQLHLKLQQRDYALRHRKLSGSSDFPSELSIQREISNKQEWKTELESNCTVAKQPIVQLSELRYKLIMIEEKKQRKESTEQS